MKKIIVFIISILFTSCLPGCGSKEPIEYEDEAKNGIVLFYVRKNQKIHT